jgi:hypothetical protein
MNSTPFSRFLLRLRDRALRGYEILLFGMLVAMALVIGWSADPAGADAAVQCGNIQSSTVVISR